MLNSVFCLLRYYCLRLIASKHFSFKSFVKIPFGFSLKATGMVQFNGNTTLNPGGYFGVTQNGFLNIGRNVYFGRNVLVACQKSIIIGDNCLFGPNVTIYDHDHLIKEGKTQNDQFVSSEVVIEKDCWIGAGVIILRGSHIGEGSVIGAGTVVKGSIPPHTQAYNKQELVTKLIREL